MISGISSMNTTTMTMQSNKPHRPPPPPEKDVFQVADTDGDGVVSSSELSTVVEAINETTGSTINVDEAIASYDLEQDGGLSGEELLAMLTDNGFGSPAGMPGEAEAQQPPSTEQALASYRENAGEDMLMELLNTMQNSSNSSKESYSINTKA